MKSKISSMYSFIGMGNALNILHCGLILYVHLVCKYISKPFRRVGPSSEERYQAIPTTEKHWSSEECYQR